MVGVPGKLRPRLVLQFSGHVGVWDKRKGNGEEDKMPERNECRDNRAAACGGWFVGGLACEFGWLVGVGVWVNVCMGLGVGI